jgi:hypothetical protein
MTLNTWAHRATIGGVETVVTEIHSAHGTAQPVGTCSLTIPLPLPAQVTDGASVVVELVKNGVDLAAPIFSGTFRALSENVSIDGNLATISCEGNGYRLAYALEKDIVYAGGARRSPQTLFSSSKHIGTQSVAWYDHPAPTASTYTITDTPVVDSNFVWMAGQLHGTNSYDTDIGDLKITDWSRIEVWQAGEKIGYGNFPESSENWSGMDDYTDPDNWTAFEMFISCPIVAADGALTFKFVSGTKPGSTDRDEYEVDDVTWQTAGDVPIRALVRALCQRGGFGGTKRYIVHEVTDLDSHIVQLGGNGWVDAGQIRLTAADAPGDWITRVGGLFGFAGFDSPDGIWRFSPMRGRASDAAVVTFTEGLDCFTVSRSDDPSRLVNVVRIEGASGTKPNGKPFAYASETAPADIVAHPLIPNPPGKSYLRMSDALLISNARCADVREIQEANHAAATAELSWTCEPVSINPARVVKLTAPTVGFDDKLFLTSIAIDVDGSGYQASLTGWTGVDTLFGEIDDPDETELFDDWTDPRPTDEWQAYRPRGGVA